MVQADAFSRFARLYDETRRTSAISEAACWEFGRRKFFDIATEEGSHVIEAVSRTDGQALR